jgi:hypothetical protein
MTAPNNGSTKTFLIYFAVTLSIITIMGLFFIYNEIIEHKNDVITHSQQTKQLEDVFMSHINATKKGVGLIEEQRLFFDQINKSTFNKTAQ